MDVDILLVDDNTRFRTMVKRLIAGSIITGAVVHECANGDDAIVTYMRERPHWVVMDIELGETDGLTATRAILRQDPGAKIIVVTQYKGAAYKEAAKEAGAHAFLPKDELSSLPLLLHDHPENPVQATDQSRISITISTRRRQV